MVGFVITAGNGSRAVYRSFDPARWRNAGLGLLIVGCHTLRVGCHYRSSVFLFPLAGLCGFVGVFVVARRVSSIVAGVGILGKSHTAREQQSRYKKGRFHDLWSVCIPNRLLIGMSQMSGSGLKKELEMD